jgi:hypothetical protein
VSNGTLFVWFAKLFIPSIALAGIVTVIVLIKNLFTREKQNRIEEISLLGKKIEIDNSQKSIDQLTNESNVEHGVGLGQKPPGDPDSKE